MKLIVALSIAAMSAHAFAAAALPAGLHGRWYGVSAGGASLSFDISVSELALAADGKVIGRLTRFGNGCGADGDPLVGTFDGTTLSFESTSRPGVHTRRSGGDCGTDKYSLVSAPDGKSFSGTMSDKQGNVFRIDLTS
jgi:hypothetical protein